MANSSALKVQRKIEKALAQFTNEQRIVILEELIAKYESAPDVSNQEVDVGNQKTDLKTAVAVFCNWYLNSPLCNPELQDMIRELLQEAVVHG